MALSKLRGRGDAVENLLAASGGGHAAAIGMEGWCWKRRLELEGGADVNRLAVAAIVLQRGQPLAIDFVANAAGQSDSPGQRIRAADIQRIIVALPRSEERRVGKECGCVR